MNMPSGGTGVTYAQKPAKIYEEAVINTLTELSVTACVTVRARNINHVLRVQFKRIEEERIACIQNEKIKTEVKNAWKMVEDTSRDKNNCGRVCYTCYIKKRRFFDSLLHGYVN